MNRRMMARARWTQKPSRFCCPGHDPNYYYKGQQRSREKNAWRKELRSEFADYDERLMMTSFPKTFSHVHGATVDLTGIPKESISVSVVVRDDTLKKKVEELATEEEAAMKRFAAKGMYGAASNCKIRRNILDQVLTLMAVS